MVHTDIRICRLIRGATKLSIAQVLRDCPAETVLVGGTICCGDGAALYSPLRSRRVVFLFCQLWSCSGRLAKNILTLKKQCDFTLLDGDSRLAFRAGTAKPCFVALPSPGIYPLDTDDPLIVSLAEKAGKAKPKLRHGSRLQLYEQFVEAGEWIYALGKAVLSEHGTLELRGAGPGQPVYLSKLFGGGEYEKRARKGIMFVALWNGVFAFMVLGGLLLNFVL